MQVMAYRSNGDTSNIERIFLYKDSGATAGTEGDPITGLAFNTSLLNISTIAHNEQVPITDTSAATSSIEAVGTLGTYSTPTSGFVRFSEVDATDMPGLYELQWEDARYAVSSAIWLDVCISGVADLAPFHGRIYINPLPVNVTQFGGGAIPTPAVTGVPDVNTTHVTDTAQTALDINDILDDTADMQPRVAAIEVDTGTTLPASLSPLLDAMVLTSAVIETVTNQTNFIIPATADATDNDAYHGATAVFIDGTDPNQKSIRLVTGYTASTRTVTVQVAPDFTITTSDTLTILTAAYVEGIWDQILTGATHNIINSAGRRLRQIEQAFVHASGTIATVTNGHTLTLDSGAVATTDYYIGDRLQIIEGTGAGQSRLVVAYTSGRVCTLDSDFTTNPDTSSLWELDAADVHVSVSDADLAEGFVATYTNTTTITLDSGAIGTTDFYVGELIVFTHGTGSGQAREITAYTSGRVVTMAPALVTALDTTTTWHIQAVVSIPEIVDEIWDETLSDHTTAGSTGKAVTDIETDAAAILVDTAVIGALGAGLTDLGGMSTTMKGQVNTEVDNALNVTTYAEPAKGLPAATTTIQDKIGFLYKAWRNRATQTATVYSLYNDDASTVDHDAAVSDDTTTAERSEMTDGP